MLKNYPDQSIGNTGEFYVNTNSWAKGKGSAL